MRVPNYQHELLNTRSLDLVLCINIKDFLIYLLFQPLVPQHRIRISWLISREENSERNSVVQCTLFFVALLSTPATIEHSLMFTSEIFLGNTFLGLTRQVGPRNRNRTNLIRLQLFTQVPDFVVGFSTLSILMYLFIELMTLIMAIIITSLSVVPLLP